MPVQFDSVSVSLGSITSVSVRVKGEVNYRLPRKLGECPEHWHCQGNHITTSSKKGRFRSKLSSFDLNLPLFDPIIICETEVGAQLILVV